MNDDESYLIRERSHAIKRSSVISLLKEKEFEIKASIVKTRQEAEEIINQAKSEAENLIEEMKTKGITDGEDKARKIIKKAEKEAQRIKNEAMKELPELQASLEVKTDRAAQIITEILLAESSVEDLLRAGGE